MAIITYNGYSDLTNVKIDSWITAARFAEDGLSIQSHEHRVSGTALISGTAGAGAGSFRLKYAEARAKLTRPRGRLIVQLGAELLYDTGDGGVDEFGGPILSFRPTQVSALHAVVAFDLTFWITDKAATGETAQGDVLSHRWIQEWEFGPDMMMHHRVAGSIRVRQNAAPTTGDLSANPATALWAVGSAPDAYRGLVVPPLPPGFRRQSMRFGEDDSGNEAVYVVEDMEFARDIPAPALTGNGSFTFTRQLLGAAFMGHKSFEVELAAPTEVPVKDLLAAAVQVSKARIVYAGALADMLLEISVREPAVLSENKIIYRVEAQCLSMGAGAAGGPIAPPNFQLLSNLLAGPGGGPGGEQGPALEGYADPGVYGTGGRLARSLRRVLYPASVGSVIPSVPRAQFRHSKSQPPEPITNIIPTTEYIGPINIADFTGGPDTIPPGTEVNANQNDAWIHVRASDRVYVEDTGMRLLRSQRAAGGDQAVQMFKPRVRVVSDFEGARLNKPVHRPLRAQHPAGAIVIEDRFEPTSGSVDANGQRVFSARHRRVLELAHAANYPQGGNPGWSEPTPGSPLTFWPGGASDGHLAMAPDPTTLNQDVESHIFLVAGVHTYFLGPLEPYVT